MNYFYLKILISVVWVFNASLVNGQCPDPSIGVMPGSGILEDNLIRNCSSIPEHQLDIYNASSTYSTNVSYTISWGDGAIEVYDNNSFSSTDFISHVYTGFGYYEITISVTSTSGCVEVGAYTFYNGSNPSVGLAAPGNTTGLCAPASISFPISNTANNPVGTEYFIYVSGELIVAYTQDNLPGFFSYTFTESSCGLTTSTGNYQNAFDVQIEAINPCGSSQATIEPIEISTPPDFTFSIDQAETFCAGQSVTFSNTGEASEIVSGNPSTCTSLPPSWSITPGVPGVDWEIISGNFFGSQEIIVVFLTPGVYTMTMELNSASCGGGGSAQTFEVLESVNTSAEITLETLVSGNPDDCAVTQAFFDGETTGENPFYIWSIDPPTGWSFEPGYSATSEDLYVNFFEGGNYSVSLETQNFCSIDVWDTVLVIKSVPNVAIQPFDNFCETATLNFDSTNVDYDSNNGAISSIVWSFPGAEPSVFTGAYPTNIFYNSIGTNTFSVTVANECGENTISGNVNITSASTITLMDDQVVCIYDAPFEVTANPPGGVWSGNGVSVEGLFSPNENNVGENILYYSYYENNCHLIDSMTVTVSPPIQVDAGEDMIVCVSDPIFLIPGGTPANGTWTVNNGGQILGNNAFDPSLVGAGVFTLTYTVTSADNCIFEDSKTMIVHELPMVDAGIDEFVCQNSFDLILTGQTPLGGIWSGDGVTPAGVFNQNNVVGGGNIHVLTYTYVDPITGCSSFDTKIITVEPNEVANAGDDIELCLLDGSINLMDGTPLGGTWTGNGIEIGTNTFDPTVAGIGTHLITYAIGAGICKTTDTKLITIHPSPQISLPPLQDMCLYEDSVSLNAASPPVGIWTGNGIQNGFFHPSLAGVGSHLLTYHVVNVLTGCSSTEEITINVFPSEVPNFDIPDVVCRNQDIVFDNLSAGSNSFLWEFGDGNTSDAFSPTYAYDVVGTFEVELTLTTPNGCIEKIQDSIIVTDVPVAYFVPDTTEACVGLELNLTNLSVGENMSYHWTFGENVTSDLENPDFVFLENGISDTTYIITLEVSNLCGASSYQDLITIHPLPQANIGMSPLTDCSPLVVAFANISIGAPTDFFWDYGNGNTSTDAIPTTQTYFAHDNQQTTYTATLISSNLCGSDTTTFDVVVEPPNVNAFGNASPVTGCFPYEVDFSNYSTPGAVVEWDFGDGNKSSDPNPSHTYQHPGEFTVVLFAYSDCGYDTMHVDIKVYPPPIVKFTHPDFICLNEPVSFENTSSPLGSTIWDFGDGDSSLLASPIHVFSTPGVHEVTLTGISLYNQCTASYTSQITILDLPKIEVTPSVTIGCSPLEVEFTNNSIGQGNTFYQWDFGDGNFSVAANPTFTFEEVGTFQVSLSMTDGNGCVSDSTIHNIIVHPTPEADFEYEQSAVCGLPAEVFFENLAIGEESYWDFGNGNTSTQNNPTTIYFEEGEYEVTLISKTQYGCEDTLTKIVTVLPEPFAHFDIPTTEGCAPLEVTFNNYSTEGNQYFWDFGNGNTSTEKTPTAVFEYAGDFDVQLIVSNQDICFDTITIERAVKVYPIPIANFEIQENPSGTSDGTIQLVNLSANADTYLWEFSDGTFSDEKNPSHRFLNNGNYQILLEAISAQGCQDDTLVNFTPTPVAGLFIPNAFSPELGLGDVRLFKPAGVGLKEYHIQIFSPYGQLLWESQALENGQPAEAWDGTVNGQLLAQDVYVWKVFAIFENGSIWQGSNRPNKGKSTIGSVTLLR